MTSDFELLHKDDFGQVYDLDRAGPYYRGLAPSDYRMPDVLCGLLKRVRRCIASARGTATLRVLDFACGYGANGALLRHRLSMSDLYRLYASDKDASGHQGFFESRRESESGFDIGGLDLASNALAHAERMGFIDSAFCEDLCASEPSGVLCEFLLGADLVVESGSLGALLPTVFPKLLGAAARERPPWFLYCPRPDVEWASLARAWSACDYVAETCNAKPIRYRKPLSPHEGAEVRRLALELGVAAERVIGDGYILVDLMLARPRTVVERAPLRALVAGCGDLWG